MEIGKRFHKLVIISKGENIGGRRAWKCLCDCGNTTVVSTLKLTSGNTKSCGCLRKEKAKNNIKKATKTITKYHPRITSARRRWKSYCLQDKNCNLTFDQWYELSQQNCFYCDISPSMTYNYFIKKKDASDYARENGYFNYNGLDRINSDLFHTIDNVVACCYICNRAKNNKTIDQFYDHINRLSNGKNKVDIVYLELPGKYQINSLKEAYNYYLKNYQKMEIDLQTFHNYCQMDCYYCGISKLNCCNVYLKDKKMSQKAKDMAYYFYNGIDRVDNNLGHTAENIVPCCFSCNFAKSNLSLEEFNNWIMRVIKYQKEKPCTLSSNMALVHLSQLNNP